MPGTDVRAQGFAVSRSTLALAALWVATAVAVVAAQATSPSTIVRLTIRADSLGFTLSGAKPQLLIGTTHVASLTVSGFDALTVGDGQAALRPGDSGASLTIRPADIESVSAAPGTKVRLSQVSGEPLVRVTVQGTATGIVRVPAAAIVNCYRCGDAARTRADGVGAGQTWRLDARSGGGGTDLLLDTGGAALVVSDDDVRIEGEVETREPSGDELVSTIRGGQIEFPAVGRTRELPARARLTIGGVQPGSGVLKQLAARDGGVAAIVEARVDQLALEEAGERTSLMPTYLELGFRNQRWLYIVQGLLLTGGTLTKVLGALKPKERAA